MNADRFAAPIWSEQGRLAAKGITCMSNEQTRKALSSIEDHADCVEAGSVFVASNLEPVRTIDGEKPVRVGVILVEVEVTLRRRDVGFRLRDVILLAGVTVDRSSVDDERKARGYAEGVQSPDSCWIKLINQNLSRAADPNSAIPFPRVVDLLNDKRGITRKVRNRAAL